MRWKSDVKSRLVYWILGLLPQDEVRDYASEVLDLMSEDAWRDAAADSRESRYDAYQ